MKYRTVSPEEMSTHCVGIEVRGSINITLEMIVLLKKKAQNKQLHVYNTPHCNDHLFLEVVLKVGGAVCEIEDRKWCFCQLWLRNTVSRGEKLNMPYSAYLFSFPLHFVFILLKYSITNIWLFFWLACGLKVPFCQRKKDCLMDVTH